LIRYKAVSAKPKAKDDPANKEGMMEFFLASRRSEDVLKMWLDQLRKEATITVNPTITAGR
jgi:hypothetical protein